MPLLPRFLAALLPAVALAQGPLLLPTENDALLRGEGAEFYQFVERDFRGERTYPWEGGQYGFTRTPQETPAGKLILVQFHEGLDIKPLRRDAQGEPLDLVRAIAAGRVVHASSVPGYSNYGRYVVVEHRWGGCPYYSLSAHLAEISVQEGQEVAAGATLGRMGHTGAGINKLRSHVHFEVNLMLTRRFQEWYDAGKPTESNRHGIYNGINLAGFDVARFYLEKQRNPALTVPEFLGREETFFKVVAPAAPGGGAPELLQMYPWMGPSGATTARPGAWEISFARSGLPLRVDPAAGATVTAASGPILSWIKKAEDPYWMLTRRLVFTTNNRPGLSPYGRRLVELIMALPPPAAAAAPVTPGDRPQQ